MKSQRNGVRSADEADHARPAPHEQGTWFSAVRAASVPYAALTTARILRDQPGLSVEDIADAAGLSVRGVRKSLRRLERLGFVATSLGGGRAPGGGGKRNTYELVRP